MNAIVGLCHFCEAHGPRPVFCTFTTDDERNTTEPSNPGAQCNGCRSLGPETVLASKDDDGTIYCSRESVPNPDVAMFLRQAAVRSITCEVSWNKEGGVIYFSDTRGHILSLTFQVKDSRARGLKRWFSIVVLMKDKMLLLNITPLLSEHMKEISKELQKLAEKVYEDEQKVCSQRALRLNTGCNYFGQSRSLNQLTGDEEIYQKLHTYFTKMLKAGALTYSETLYTSNDLFKKLNYKDKGTSIFAPNMCNVPTIEGCIALRDVEKLLGKSVFRIILFCTLTGINIIIKSNRTESPDIVKALLNLLPVTSSDDYSHIKISQQFGITSSEKTCILEDSDNNTFSYRWPGTLPAKCPTLMTRIESAMNNTRFADDVLNQFIKSVQLEWLGIAKALKSAIDASGASSAPVHKLKQVFGVAAHDETLVNFWINTF